MTRPGMAEPGRASVPTHGVAGVADAGAFLARLVRLDPTAPVRLRPAGGPGRVALWARLPWQVLVVRTVAGGPADGPAEDVTVAAAELLAELEHGGAALPTRRDAQWRWPLPSVHSRQVEALPVAELRRIADAAAGTLRTASEQGVAGRAVGQRALRDALLDHVAVRVTPDGAPASPVEVPQRLVQGWSGWASSAPPTARSPVTMSPPFRCGWPAVGSAWWDHTERHGCRRPRILP